MFEVAVVNSHDNSTLVRHIVNTRTIANAIRSTLRHDWRGTSAKIVVISYR